MTTQLNPYLNFRGNAREAMEFYRSVLGGDLEISTFADQGGMDVPDDEQQQVMHARLSSEDIALMGADSPSGVDFTPPGGFSLSLSGDDDAKLRGWWTGLSEGARINMPLEVAPWGDTFGMLTDKFGIDWMVNIAGPGNAG